MSYLPDEIWLLILNYLDIRSLYTFQKTNKHKYILSNDNNLWKQKFYDYCHFLIDYEFMNKEQILIKDSNNWKNHFKSIIKEIKILEYNERNVIKIMNSKKKYYIAVNIFPHHQYIGIQ